MPRKRTPKVKKEDDHLKDLWSKDPVQAKALAKADYFAYGSLNYISARYGIPLPTLRNWIYKYRGGKDNWKEEKDLENAKIFKEILNSNDVKKNIEAISEVGLAIVLRVLKEVFANENKVSIGEAQKLMDLISRNDTMYRLLQGEATQIVAKVDATPQGVKKLIEEMAEVDPYADYDLTEDEKEIIQ